MALTASLPILRVIVLMTAFNKPAKNAADRLGSGTADRTVLMAAGRKHHLRDSPRLQRRKRRIVFCAAA